jgi:hypothetical protein
LCLRSLTTSRLDTSLKISSALDLPSRFEESRCDARGRGYSVTRELNVLALFKGEERYIFVYDEESSEALIDDIRHKAADPSIPINWFDAAVLTERIRNREESPQEEF